jgi:serine phosphatase RsbU (regulator of sigma subunit)
VTTSGKTICRLVVESGEQEGMIFPLRETVVSIGRGPDNTIQIIDTRLSRNHTMMILNDSTWFLRDLKSKNGTLINGEKIEGDRPLAHGDRIQAGDSAFVFEQESAADTGAAGGLRVSEDEGLVTASHVLEMGKSPDTQPPGTPLSADDAKRLSILYRVAEMNSSTLNLDELLDKILDLIQEFLAPDRAGVLLYDEQYDILLPKVIRRPPDSTDDIVISNTIISQAINQQVAILVGDAPRDYRFSASDSIVIQRIHSAMCVPLIYKEEVLGVLYLDRRRPAENYQQSDLKLVVGIANQSSLAIANSRLHYRLLDQHARERELEIAREIQMRLLPTEMPRIPGFQIHGLSEPARMVGGDYFDMIPLSDGRYVIAVADVSGKGVPAAILLASVRAAVQVEVRGIAQTGLRELVDRLNQMICRDTGNSMFVTMVIAILDPVTRTLTYCNAGHVHPLLLRPSGAIESLETGGCLLGVMPGEAYEIGEVTLEPGARLIAYSDGVTDMMNPDQEMFGIGRLLEWLREHGGLSAEETCRRLESATRDFRQGAEPFDDFTLLVLRALDA